MRQGARRRPPTRPAARPGIGAGRCRQEGTDHVTEVLIALTTFATADDAARVVRVLVEERLIACGNIVPGVRSLYRWQGAVADEAEVLVVMKTRKQDWAALLSRLHELHPYDTPECLAVRVAAGAPKYLEWLAGALEPAE
jgi:periplasmic divalent cation tolerance protein